jgi:hypothetical protein
MSSYRNPIVCFVSRQTIKSVAGLAFAVARSQMANVRRSSNACWRSCSALDNASCFACSYVGSLEFVTARVSELALGRIWSIDSIDSLRLSLRYGPCGDVPRATTGAEAFRVFFGVLLGPVRCKLALVPLRNVEFATLRNDAGSARRKRCDRGSCCVGGESWLMPIGAICDGGIHGASR